MKEKKSDKHLMRKNFSLKHTNDKPYITSYSNITGVNIPKMNHSAKYKNIKNISRSYSISNVQNNYGKTAINFYSSLKREEKIDYINNIINNAYKKDSFDFMALKRKKISIKELIHQFSDKSKKFEKNKIDRIPYPLLYCLSNRKVENNSSNLLTKILTRENNNLSKKQELTIKYSQFSKMFNTELSKLVSSYETLNSKTPKISRNNFPILNKYLKREFNNIYGKNNFAKSMSDSPVWTKIKITKKNEENSPNYIKIYSKNRKNENEDFKNIIETPKSKSMNLFNHNNNMKNVKMINERFNNYLEEKLMGKNNSKIDSTINNIIKDVSHLKFNNNIMAFSDKIKAV